MNSIFEFPSVPVPTKIQSVPQTMGRKSEFKKYYVPQKFSVGPIHVYNKELKAYTLLKFKLATKFIQGSGKDMPSLFHEVRNKITDLKKCFDERVITRFDDLRTNEIKKDPVINETVIKRFDHELQMMLDEHDQDELDNSLARLLFLDGCAVLQFIHSFEYDPDELKELKINNDEATLIQQDLFLMENQIPYSLLRLLIGLLPCKDKKKKYIKAIFALVHNNNILSWPIGYNLRKFLLEDQSRSFIAHHYLELEQYESMPNHDLGSKREESLPNHILDLLRSIIFGNHDGLPVDRCEKKSSDCLSCNPNFGTTSQQNSQSKDQEKKVPSLFENMAHDDKRSFRNVQELKSAWIKLKPSDSPDMRSVSFGSTLHIRGHLRIPSLIVDNWTKGKLLNLVAYERCLGNEKRDYVVTSFLKLIDLLIDSEKDVEELRKASIVRHHLISDKDVADLFNSLGSNCWLRPDQ